MNGFSLFFCLISGERTRAGLAGKGNKKGRKKLVKRLWDEDEPVCVCCLSASLSTKLVSSPLVLDCEET